MAQVSLDLSGIARSMPRIPEPISDALTALQTGVNNIDNDNISAGAAIAISKTALGIYTPWTAYTPVIYGGTVEGAGTYTTQAGEYCQMGKNVFFSVVIVITAHTGSGTARITLPITSGTFSNSTLRYCFSCRYTSLASGDDVYDAVVNVGPGNTYCDIYQVGIGKTGIPFQLEDDTSFTLMFSGFYRVD